LLGDAAALPIFKLIDASIFAAVDAKRRREPQVWLPVPSMKCAGRDLVAFRDQRVRKEVARFQNAADYLCHAGPLSDSVRKGSTLSVGARYKKRGRWPTR